MNAAAGDGEARRATLILAASQAIVGSAAPIAFALGALSGHYLLAEDKALATLPVTGFTVGVALGAIPAATLIKRAGYRLGFQSGTAVTALGGLLTMLGLLGFSFWLFSFGMLVLGLGGAFIQQVRFAAADYAPPALKARAISLVLAGGVVTAILGPQIVILTRDLFAPVMFAGAFASIIGLAVVGAAILLFLPRRKGSGGTVTGLDQPARPLGEIMRQPRFVVGLTCGVGTYALMSFVMTGAPLAMVGCGFSPDEATLGISWHVMAMFAPSFVTGRLIARFGAEAVVALGLALLVGCGLVALSGIQLWQFWSALVLLGMGWNFGFIGTTAMIAGTYRPSEQGKVLGVHDFILFGTVSLASFLSGVVYDKWGWEALNWVTFPVVLMCVAGLVFLRLISRRTASISGI
ncbi:MAG: MFS transporter [Aquamicrobium sp.]|uniref:MFS transporter n=1 Tax=Aquamicrobium sp. TaxID=1872579 RepID=UPI00349E4D1A|nr:MFS transporter [Aquamicrobium sp.]